MPSHSQVAHLWSNQSASRSQTPASRGSNMYFEGDTIFSYGRHFAIAKHVNNRKGVPAVLFTQRDYSKTTSKHKSDVRSALNGLACHVFYVSQVDTFDHTSESEWKSEFLRVANDAAKLVAKAKRARSTGLWYLEHARQMLERMEEARSFFGIRSKVPTFEAIGPGSDWVAKIQAKAEATAKREAAERKRAQARRDEQQRIEHAEAQVDLALWLDGGNVRLPYCVQEDEHGSAYLRTRQADARIDNRGQYVQTSRGAEVPFDDAVRAFRFVKLCRMTGRAWQAHGHSIIVGSFAFRTVTAEGNAQVGCHFLTWERMSEWADRNGLTDVPATDEALVQSHPATH